MNKMRPLSDPLLERLIRPEACSWCGLVSDILQMDEFGTVFCSDKCQKSRDKFIEMAKEPHLRGSEL